MADWWWRNIAEPGRLPLFLCFAVPGIVLLVAGAFLAIRLTADAPWPEIAAVAIGIGTSLVLDEFALILHLKDVGLGSGPLPAQTPPPGAGHRARRSP